MGRSVACALVILTLSATAASATEGTLGPELKSVVAAGPWAR
jgi:hypothetical protein